MIFVPLSEKVTCKDFSDGHVYKHNCFKFNGREWILHSNLTTARSFSSSIALNDTTMWVLGGIEVGFLICFFRLPKVQPVVTSFLMAFYLFLSLSCLFLPVSSCFLLPPTVLLCFPWFPYVFLCFPLFPPVSSCFPLFSLVSLCFPLFLLVFPLDPCGSLGLNSFFSLVFLN